MYFGRLYEKIAMEKLTMLGTPITIYHSLEYDPAGNDTEFAIPIEEALKGRGIKVCAERFVLRVDLGLCQAAGMDRE